MPPRGKQRIEVGIAGGGGKTVEQHGPDTAVHQQHVGLAGIARHREHGVGLEEEGDDNAGGHPAQNRGDGRYFAGRHIDHQRHRREQQRIDLEVGVEQLERRIQRAFRLGAGFAETHQRKQGEGDEQARRRRPGHVADVGEYVDAGDGGRQVGGIGQRRHLVAEIGAADDRSGRYLQGQAHAGGNADEANAQGARHGPGTADGKRRDCAEQAGSRVEDGRIEQQHSVVDHGRHRAAEHPCANQAAHGEEDDHRRQGRGNATDDGLFDDLPVVAVLDADAGGQRRPADQRDLVGALRGVAAEERHGHAEEQDGDAYADDDVDGAGCFDSVHGRRVRSRVQALGANSKIQSPSGWPAVSEAAWPKYLRASSLTIGRMLSLSLMRTR